MGSVYFEIPSGTEKMIQNDLCGGRMKITIIWKSKAQIQISMMQWQDVPPVEAMTVSDLKFWKVNLNTQNNPPYIFDTGDKIIIDTEKVL